MNEKREIEEKEDLCHKEAMRKICRGLSNKKAGDQT